MTSKGVKQKYVSLTSRKKRPLDRSEGLLRDAKLFVIATEGKETEKQYFALFQNLKVKLNIIPTEDSKSSPEYVLERLDAFWEDYQLDDGDELWLMVDVDRWGDKKLSQIAQACIQKGYGLAISNPCFELWLYLHIVEVANSESFAGCNAVEALLRKELGSYNKAKLVLSCFEKGVVQAIARARELHSNAAERFPSKTGSHVYKVVEKLL